MDVFIEPIGAEEHLVIFGAGHVALPTAQIAAILGFHVQIVDERDELNTADRFPNATRHVVNARTFARDLATDARTYVLIMTHDHGLDQDVLELLIAKSWAWLGLIGSRAKLAKFFIRLRAAGVDERLFARVSGPVGLDVAAETPAEIATSIAAELVRVRRNSSRPAQPLSEIPLQARGGDGIAHPPGLSRT